VRPAAPEDRLQAHFSEVRAVIQAEEMWERVPQEAQEFSPENLENLVKFAYFGGFIDLAAARRLLLVDRREIRRVLARWYEEIREKGCWLC
jgi:RNA binding exosome subunit